VSRIAARNPRLIKAVQHVSTLDSRTSLICRVRHGNRYSLPDYQPLRGTRQPYLGGPPYHAGCRSIMTLILAGFDDAERDPAERTFAA
jgi:hypothetical protein